MSLAVADAPSPAPERRRRRRPTPPDVARGDDAWVGALNCVAARVLAAEGTEAWRDFERCWYDLHALFGAASALRLLNLAELVVLVDYAADAAAHNGTSVTSANPSATSTGQRSACGDRSSGASAATTNSTSAAPKQTSCQPGVITAS